MLTKQLPQDHKNNTYECTYCYSDDALLTKEVGYYYCDSCRSKFWYDLNLNLVEVYYSYMDKLGYYQIKSNYDKKETWLDKGHGYIKLINTGIPFPINKTHLIYYTSKVLVKLAVFL